MWMNILKSLWQFIKVGLSIYAAICFMRLAEHFGATTMEAGFAVVSATVIWIGFLIVEVAGTVGDSFHPKIDNIVEELRDARARDSRR